MSTTLSDKTITLVKATVPALEAHGLAVTQRMYEHLFRTPAIRDLFNQSHHGEGGSQPKALAAAVLAYARHIDNLDALGPMVERIAQKHVGLTILPEHYPYVADALLKAIAEVLGDAASAEVLAAWGEAYWFLAELLIGREAAIYRDLAAQPGGWNGWRDFVVEGVTQESEIIRSFVLRPADGGKVLRHLPGQYLTFALDLPELGVVKRNYSISCAPNDARYRITVKREPAPAGRPDLRPGAASSWLHETAVPGTVLRVAPPAGDFVLGEAESGPVVLVSGGVGLTPMLSMLETIAATRPDLPSWYVHGAQNGRVHAMGARVRELAARGGRITARTFYAEPGPDDRAGRDYDERGLISAEWLAANTPMDQATYYLCGPRPFLRALVGGLARKGVAGERIRYELFGPADDLMAA